MLTKDGIKNAERELSDLIYNANLHDDMFISAEACSIYLIGLIDLAKKYYKLKDKEKKQKKSIEKMVKKNNWMRRVEEQSVIMYEQSKRLAELGKCNSDD